MSIQVNVQPSAEQRFSDLSHQHRSTIRRCIYRFNLPYYGIDPEDLVQEVWMKLWKILRADSDKEINSSYVRRLTNSVVIDTLRRHKIVQKSVEAGKTKVLSERESKDCPRTDILLVRAEISRVILSRQKVLRLFLMGYSPVEISEILGCNLRNVHMLFHRGIKDLRNRIQYVVESAHAAH